MESKPRNLAVEMVSVNGSGILLGYHNVMDSVLQDRVLSGRWKKIEKVTLFEDCLSEIE